MRPYLVLIAIFGFLRGAPAAEPAFRVPAGFSVDRVAADELAHDIWCLTLDPAGRIVVGGPGYIKRLEDRDGDGHCDAAVDLAAFERGGPQGLCYVGEDLWHVGPERLGVIRANPAAEPLPREFLQFGSSGEHGAHAIVHGPDGYLYVVCGNSTEPTSRGQKLDRDGQAIAGRVLRFRPPAGPVEVVAWGFRNPYDLAFTADGRLLTVDSDNERAHHLPWYAPTRMLEVIGGRGHGWLLEGYQSSWNRPASFFDSAPRIVELGRGSPTGLVVYEHTRFPQRYRGGAFSACWTFGRVYFVALAPSDVQQRLIGRSEVFLAPASDDGFAPVDLAVSSDGDLLVAIGGRHTQGGVFRVRWMANEPATRQQPPSPGPGLAPLPIDRSSALDEVLARWQADDDPQSLWPQALARLGDNNSATVRLEAVRVLQILLGDIVAVSKNEDLTPGYVAADPNRVSRDHRAEAARAIVDCFPTRDAELNRELARLFAMLDIDAPGALAKIVAMISTTTPEGDDVHYLTVASLLASDQNPETTAKLVAALLGLHSKLARRQATPSREWPEWVGRVYRRLCSSSPGLKAAIVADPGFGAAEHVLFTEGLSPEQRTLAARRILGRLEQSDAGEKLTPEVVRLVAELPADESLPALRVWFDDFACRDSVALALARQRQPDDRTRLVEALTTTDAGILRRVAEALSDMPPAAGAAADAKELVGALRRLCRASGDKGPAQTTDREARAAIVGALSNIAGRTFEIDPDQADLQAAHAACFAWFAEAYPDEAARLGGSPGDLAKRFSRVDWSKGDAKRGRHVYQRKSCARCHERNDRLGPELKGIAARLSREDLLAAIAAPNRDFTPQYEATLVETRSGHLYQGMIVYESPEGVLLRTGADTTVRIEGHDLARQEPARRSFMPEGLLDDLSEKDLADLYAYLKQL